MSETSESLSGVGESVRGPEQERQVHLRFFESMDLVNRAMQGANDLEQMMSDVLDALLGIFDCDRAWLVHPCDPAAASWQVAMERNRPEYPGGLALGLEVPMDPDVATVARILTDSAGPVKFGSASQHRVPPAVARDHGVQSFIAMAIYPKGDKPYMFGLHQCSHARTWTPEDEQLLQAVGQRLSDGLTSLLTHRNLQESERRHREIFENASDCLLLVDVTTDGRFQFAEVNPAEEKAAGYTSSTASGKFVEEIFSEEAAQQFTANGRRCLDAGTLINFEESIALPAGLRFFQTTLIPIRDGAGRIHRVLRVARDITESKRSGQRLALLSFALNRVQEAAYLIDEQARFHYVNDESCRVLGYTREELLGLGVPDIGPDYPLERWVQHWRELKEHGSLTFETRHRAKDGRVFPVEITANYFEYEGCAYNLALVRDITERRRAEDAMRQNEADRQLALDAGRLGDWKWNIVTGEVHWSAVCKSLYGLAPDAEMTYDRFLEIVHPDDRARVQAELNRALETHTDYETEKRVVWPDGSIRWQTTRAHVFYDVAGNPLQMAGVTMDITKLKEAERQIRTLTEHSPDLIARFDQECRFLYVNSVVEQITGISAREFLGKRVGELTWERIYPAVPEDLLALRGAIKKAFTGVTLETEVRVPLPGGQRILTVRLVPEYDDAGQVVTVLHVGRDITERHRTEQALRESQARLELANHATRIGAWEWDLRTNQVHFSAEWKRQLGCGEHEIPNRYEEWESRLHPEDRERVLATLRDYLAGQLSDYEVEFRLLHKDGTYRWIFTRGEVFRDPEGKPLRMFGGHLDITDRKLAEAALRANRDRLLQQESALIALTKDELLQGGDLVASLRRLTEASAKALGVARVSLWRYQPGQQAIRCVDLYERLYDRHSDGAELAAVDYPAYFRALAECDVIAADDAHQEPRTADFSARYLTPLGITSMLDVPICLKGALDGVLCHEHIGPPRQWTSDERTFAIAIANLVALVLEEWEREQAQEELRQSQHAYASLVNTVDGIVWELDVPTLRFTFVSQQAERLLGFPIEHWLQEPTFWRDHLHPDDRELAVNFCLRVTEEMRDDDFRYRMIAVDGRVVWLHDLVTVVVENGRPAKLRGIMVDITESKLAEEALRQRTAFFEAQVDSDLDGILVVDSEGKKILQNQRMSDLWKIPPEIADDPDDAKQIQFVASRTRNPRRFAEKVAHLYAHTNEVSRDEIELTDGMVLDRYSSPVRGRDGKYYGRIWTFRDITERKRDQERIREQAALLDHTQDAVLVLSRDRRLRYCNLSAERFYGLPADQLLDQDAARLLFAEHPERCVEICQTTLERRTWSGELRHTTELGARRVVLSRWTLIRNAANQPASFLIVNTDVTEQKRLEEQFLRAQRVESIGTLASGVAHDLNNILAPILMAAELLRPLARTPEDQEVLVMIDQSARRGSDIIKQLLTFGRGVEGERIVLQPRSLLKEMVKVIRETFPKNLTLEQQFPDNLWTIQADPTQIHQVLLNLCVNARDAMPGGGKLTIAAENLVADAAYAAMNPEARPGPYVVLLIGDTGVGIPREIMHKIFDPFFTTKELGKGTGLGLSTVLGIVKSHGGFLQANSRLGEGTQFKVYLPALVEAEELQPGAPTEPLPRGHGELILVVDDEEAIRGVAQRVLEAHDYRAVTASDGVEALVTFSRSREPFQAVVTDMLMPVMDGAALIRALRHQSPGVRIIAMSGFVEQEAATAQSGLGAATFLSKPFSAERLVRTLHKILN